MPIDANIISGLRPVEIESPVNALAKVMQVQALQRSGQMDAMKMDEYRRGVEDQNQLRTALSGGGDVYNSLLKLGKVKEATEFAKGQTDADETRAKTKKLGFESANHALTQHRAMLNNVNDPAAGKQWLAAAYNNPDTKHIFERFGSLDEAIKRFDQSVKDPASFQKWKMGASMNADELVKLTTPDANAKLQAKTSTDNSIRTTNEAARGHTLTNDRALETNGGIDYKQDADGNWVALPKKPGAGPIVGKPVLGADGKPLAGANGANKPLATSDLKQLTEVRDNAVTLDRLLSGFKDDFASKGVFGLGADTSLSAKAVLGSDKDAVEWWKNYRKQAELVERHAMFGASLTPGEQASWRGADIGAGMDKDVIKKNLQTRATLTKKMLETTRQDLIDAGRSEKRVNAIAGRGPQDATPPGPNPGDVQMGHRFKGGNPADPKSWEKV
jgi:hypothetical protein